ncbi:hypothetical protein F511_21343 [Dorcoceras hygrometricum]|uniref:Uncharacterized protein n=1 Tax=Dorcoceras hygrometricum TaxID=472368 RepID=A0A2Z7CC49_9LAMI|nr:hypothetical protein F511_21343 [Dorcoceras hygrometricum]
MNQLEQVLRSLLEKKKIQVISTVDESINSRYSRSKKKKNHEAKRERLCDVVLRFSRRYLKIAIAKRCRLHELIRQRFAVALKIQQEDFALMFNQQARRISSRKKRRSRQSEEIQPVARFSRKIQQKRKRSSSRLESAGAKQLTTYEELRKAGCQLLSVIQNGESDRSLQKKRTQIVSLQLVFFECFIPELVASLRCSKLSSSPLYLLLLAATLEQLSNLLLSSALVILAQLV